VAETSPTIASLDPAACVVIRVVERADRGVEPCSDLLCERLRFLGSRQQHEVIPADVPDEALIGAGGVNQDLRKHRDHAVSSRESVVVVELLEAIDVDVEQREMLPAREARLELFSDGRVAGKPRQRVDVAHPAPAPHRRSHSRQELVGVVRLDDEVFGAGLELGELRLAVGMSGEKDDRQKARARVLPQLPVNFRAGHSG